MPPRRAEQRSLLGEILDWMLAPLLLLWPMSMGLTWVLAQGIANQPYDRELGDVARAVAQRVVVVAGPQRELHVSPDVPALIAEAMRGEGAGRVYFQVQGLRGEWVAGERRLRVPTAPGDDPGALRFRDDALGEEPLRVAYLRLTLPLHAGEIAPLVQVGETLDRRSQLATEIVRGLILPQFVILPLAVILVWFALARGLAPLSALQKRIRERESHDLSPIDEQQAPEEVAPLVQAINDLLARLDHSMGAQKHFLADAAHQLKTPLAGLRMQAELAQREIDAGSDVQAARRSLQQIGLASERAARMVNQLLALARAEDREQALRQDVVPLAALAIETVEDFVPRALDKRIDLGYEGPLADDARTVLRGQPVLVRELVRNLVDNALLYTPAGGTVTVRVACDPAAPAAVLQVEDTGPGIPETERELVFRPFYRALGTQVDGSGLGLTIAREIAAQHGAEVSVVDAHPRDDGGAPGARFTVRFPCEALPSPA